MLWAENTGGKGRKCLVRPRNTPCLMLNIPYFSSSHVWMWELDYKENWAPRNFSIKPSRSSQVVTNGRISFWIHKSHIFIHSSIDRHLDSFHALAIINNAATDMNLDTSSRYWFCFVWSYTLRDQWIIWLFYF